MRLLIVQNIVIQFLIFVNTIGCVSTSKEPEVLFCPKEISLGFFGKEFIWQSTNVSGNYLSEPICYNEHLSEVTRECRDGQWYSYSTPFCFEFICPEHSILMKNYCQYTTEPRTYYDGCPDYQGKFYENNVTNYIWRSKVENKCLVQHKTHREYVDCNTLYSHECKYWKNDLIAFSKERNISNVDIYLSFDALSREMIFTIYTPEGVSSFEDDIKCFTHRDEFEEENPQKQIEFEEIFDFRAVCDRDEYNYRNFTIFELDIKDKPLEYWCTIFVRESGTLLTTERKVGYKDNIGNEFVMYVQVTMRRKYPHDHYNYIQKICKDIRVTCRSFELFDFNIHNYTSYFMIHITTKYPKPVVEEYYKLKDTFESYWRVLNIVKILSSEWCLPQCNMGVCWGLNYVGSIAMSYQLCITKDDMIARRKCEGSFLHGAHWEDFDEECIESTTISEKTKFLFNLVHNEITTYTIKNLSTIVDRPNDLSTMDISFLSTILFRASQSYYSDDAVSDFYLTFSNLFKINNRILHASQNLLNSTDRILNAFDLFLGKYAEHTINNDNNHLHIFVQANFIVHITKPFLNNVSGLALYGDTGSFLDYTVVNIYKNQSLKTLELNNLEAATYVPEKLLYSMINSTAKDDIKANITVITTIFYNDSMFNQAANNISADSKVVSVIIPGFATYLKHPIPILLKRCESNLTDSCGFWSYGNQIQDKRGKWSNTGINYEELLSNSSVMHCAFSHLTHFALLIMSERSADPNKTSILDTYANLLSIITIICSCISLIGIMGIFLTAIVHRRWREKLGTKFLLQLSVTIVLEIILIQVAGQDHRNVSNTMCTLIGVTLHYVLLAKFAWMLIIAFLQYLRFVKVLGALPTKLLLKSMLICWLLPILPVIMTIAIFPSSYTAGYNFCYPTDLAFYIGLLVPCLLIIAANISVFFFIMRAIYTSKAMQYEKSGKLIRKQVYLAVLLFFLLGLHWIFAILGEILPDSWLSVSFMFLFCLTTGLQGFVLFAFYVVLDKDTRLMWKYSIKSRS